MKNSILTIDPGTRMWGVSVFHGRSICASFIKNLSTKDSPGNRLPQVRKTFLGLCSQYGPDIVVIKIPYAFWKRQSQHLAKTVSEILRLARKEGIKIVELAPQEIRKTLCRKKYATKDEILQTIRQFDPELVAYLTEMKMQKNRFMWGRLVDSIALGICYFAMA